MTSDCPRPENRLAETAPSAYYGAGDRGAARWALRWNTTAMTPGGPQTPYPRYAAATVRAQLPEAWPSVWQDGANAQPESLPPFSYGDPTAAGALRALPHRALREVHPEILRVD
jgi:hypothetical protein